MGTITIIVLCKCSQNKLNTDPHVAIFEFSLFTAGVTGLLFARKALRTNDGRMLLLMFIAEAAFSCIMVLAVATAGFALLSVIGMEQWARRQKGMVSRVLDFAVAS